MIILKETIIKAKRQKVISLYREMKKQMYIYIYIENIIANVFLTLKDCKSIITNY